ncbi:MAG: RluA family pseudouridine synthase [Clostridia bacterium]|nr:RluA family pseudouridine synthase [Clostridia bacterium]
MPVFKVPPELDGVSVKTFLRRHCSVSARLLAKLKRVENGMTVNGNTVRSIDTLNAGDELCLIFPEDAPQTEPVEMPLNIIYEDDAIIVLDKPPFMPVHPVRDHQRDTLANGVMFYFQSKGESITFRPVNRLDRDTSGLVLAAKSSYAHNFLKGNTKKKYTALCEGEITESGTVDAPIALRPGSIMERCVSEEGARAVTHYTPIMTVCGHTLLKLELETGRTHQIRVHMASIGHPLAGDDMYGGSRRIFARQCLHCSELALIHPLTRESMLFRSTPEDWAAELKNSIPK